MEEVEQDDSGDHSTSATPQRDVSVGRWEAEVGLAEIQVKRGKLWGSMGVIRNSKLYCHVEEAVYMVEQGSLVLFRGEDNIPLSRQEVYDLLVFPAYGCSWDAYQIFCHLKRLGYIVGRHGILWSTSRPKRRPTGVKEDVEHEESTSNPANLNPNSSEISENDHCDGQGSFNEIVSDGLLSNAVALDDVHKQFQAGNILELDGNGSTSANSSQDSCEISVDEPRHNHWKSRGTVPELVHTGLSSPAAVLKDGDEGSLMHDRSEKRDGKEKTKEKDFACLFSSLQLSEWDRDNYQNKEEGRLKLLFDVHHPNGRFKKTDPGFPAFSLCIVKGQEPPERREVCRLEAMIQGRPLKFGTVDCGHVSIFSFTTCCLPTLP